MNVIKCFARQREGSVAVMSAMLMTVLVAAAGGVIDMTRHVEAIQRAQRVLDSAMIATAREFGVDGAEERILKDHIDAFLRTGLAEASIPFSHAIGEVRLKHGMLTAQMEIDTPLLFGAFLGLDAATATVASGAGLEALRANGNDHDVILAIDNTYSLEYGELTRLRDAVQGLVGHLETDASGHGAQIRLGIVPFARYVNVSAFREAIEPDLNFASARKNEGAEWHGCIHPYYDARDSAIELDGLLEAGFDFDTLADKAKCRISPITPMTADWSLLRASLTRIVSEAGGSTYIPSGLAWARRMLEPDNPFVPHPANDAALRTVVLFSDGGNALYWVRDDAQTDRQTMQICEAIKAQGARIVVVAFALDQSMERDAAALRVLGSCASGPDYVIEVEDRDALSAAFDTVGAQILRGVIATRLRLTM